MEIWIHFYVGYKIFVYCVSSFEKFALSED